MKTAPVELVPLSSIEVPDWVERESSNTKADEKLLAKFERQGWARGEDPIHAVRENGRLLLIKGSRRRRLAMKAGVQKAPTIIEDVPPGETAEGYVRKIRFIRTEHAQAPLPTVRASLVMQMKNDWGFTLKQLSERLGQDTDTLRYWTAILDYPPEIQRAIDSYALAIRPAHILFNGLTKEGQQEVFRRHVQELRNITMDDAKRLRAQYPEKKFGAWYVSKKKPGPKRKAPKVTYTPDEKKKLLASVELKRDEFEMMKEEATRLQKQCQAAGPIAAAFLRNKSLRQYVPDAMRPELERFVEVYA